MTEGENRKRPPSRLKVVNPDQIFALAQRGESGSYTMGYAFIGSPVESISISLLVDASRFQFSSIVSYAPDSKNVGRGFKPGILTSPNGTNVAFLDHPERNHLNIQTGESCEVDGELRFQGVELTRPVFDTTLDDFTVIIDGLLMMYSNQGALIPEMTVSADGL